MFALCIDEPARLEELQEEIGKGVTIVSDALGTATREFGMIDPMGLPKRPLARSGSFLIDHEGKVSARWLPSAYRLRPPVDDILARLRRH